MAAQLLSKGFEYVGTYGRCSRVGDFCLLQQAPFQPARAVRGSRYRAALISLRQAVAAPMQAALVKHPAPHAASPVGFRRRRHGRRVSRGTSVARCTATTCSGSEALPARSLRAAEIQAKAAPPR